MKLVTFTVKTPLGYYDRVGAMYEESKVVDLNFAYVKYLTDVIEETKPYEIAAIRVPTSMLEVIKGGQVSIDAVKNAMEYVSGKLKIGKVPCGPKDEQIVYDLQKVKLKAPLTNPGRVFSMGRNYADHLEEMGGASEGLPRPVGHLKFTFAGPEDPIIYPKQTQQLDYEVEMSCVIGKKGKDISKEDWEEYVVGYTIINDVSARDQLDHKDRNSVRFDKNFDTFCPIGPCIVLKEAIEDPHNLAITLRVNGETRQKSFTSHAIHKFADIIAYISRDVTLEPGDIISCGSPPGVAMGAARRGDDSWWLKPGDVIEAEVENIGILRNPVKAQ